MASPSAEQDVGASSSAVAPGPSTTTGMRQRRGGDTDALAGPSTDTSPLPPATSALDTESILIEVCAFYSDTVSQPATQRGQRVSRRLTARELREAVVRGDIGVRGDDGRYGGPAEWAGIRFVRNGRVVGDGEALGDAVGKTPASSDTLHTFIIAFQPKPTPTRPVAVIPSVSTAISSILNSRPPPSHPTPSTSATAGLHPTRAEYDSLFLILLDRSHFLLFLARHHLCRFVGAEPLAWDATVPPPSMSLGEARRLVIANFAADDSERFRALTPLADGAKDEVRAAQLEAMELIDADEGLGGSAASASELVDSVQQAWARTGRRPWDDAGMGQVVPVEIDGTTLDLHVPPLDTLGAARLTHLLRYLRVATQISDTNARLKFVQSLMDRAEGGLSWPHAPASAPTTVSLTHATWSPPDVSATNVPPHIRAGYQFYTPGPAPANALGPAPAPHLSPEQAEAAAVLADERAAPHPPLGPLGRQAGVKAIQALATLYMLTNGMAWSDARFWFIALPAAGWWLVELVSAYSAARAPLVRAAREAGVRRRAQAAAAAGGAGVGTGGHPPHVAAPTGPAQLPGHAPAPEPAPAAAPAPNAAAPAPPAPRLTARAAIGAPAADALPQLPLFLQHHPDNPLVHLALQGLDAESRQLQLATAPSGRAQRPSGRVERRTAWVKRRVVRPVVLWGVTLVPMLEYFRERAIRARERRMREVVQGLQRNDGRVDRDEGGVTDAELELELPPGLNVDARRYYVRVMQRGEGIDWEEEREAQRAMGVPDEGGGGGDGEGGGGGGGGAGFALF